MRRRRRVFCQAGCCWRLALVRLRLNPGDGELSDTDPKPAAPSSDNRGSEVVCDAEKHGQRMRAGLEATLGVPFTEGNAAEVLRNGDEIFPRMLSAIADARRTIMFQTFVYWSGAIADRVVAALCDRARAGVDVRVLLDGFGAKPMPDRLVTSMRAAGIDVRWFRPLSVWRLGRVDNRSHRRILVIDDTIGFTGGVGIAAEWEGDAENPAHWRDNHFKCLGPCISGLSAAFLHNWLETGFDLVPALVAETVPAKAGDLCVQVVASTGSSVIPAAAIMQEALVSLAQQQIRIVTAYFAPSDHLVGAIIEAVRRGVEVEIIIPGPHIDKRVSELAGAEAFLPLLENGVTIWRYQPTMLHAKVITVDGVISCVGSPNFNQRSTGKDDEIALNVLSPEFCRILNEDFEADRAQCEKTTISDWRHRSLPRRIAEAVLSPFKPQT